MSEAMNEANTQTDFNSSDDQKASLPNRRWFTIPEAADYFAINPKTLYSLIGRERISPNAVMKLGKAIRIDIRRVEQEGVRGK